MVNEEIANHSFCFLPEKALWMPSSQFLIVSDLHLGKAEYFQQHSIAVSSDVHHRDLSVLAGLLSFYQPKCLLILGDLFHHGSLLGRDLFSSFCEQFASTPLYWVLGNHDRISLSIPSNVTVLDTYVWDSILFSHAPVPSPSFFNIHGHEHPSVTLKMQHAKMRLPCFIANDRSLVLPAFGYFTGTHSQKIQKNHDYYLIAGDSVQKLEGNKYKSSLR
jgi:DNA ligase-associated metallophosphoesterase